jgi:polyketide biosynthesis acyl carrier protein
VFELVKNQIACVLPAVAGATVLPENRLEDLGADSVDRADIATGSMDAMGLSLPLVQLGEPRTIGELVDLLFNSQ